MAIEHRIRWTPDGIIVQRHEDDRIVSQGKYANIDEALAGLRVALDAEEQAYHFPPDKFPTTMHREVEKLARAIEQRLP